MALGKFQFINNVIAKFSHYIQGEQAQQVTYDSYSRVLTRKIDYDKLWDLFCNEYGAKSPPTGVELKNLAKQCYLQDFENPVSNWLHVKVFDPRFNEVRNLDCFPKGTTQEQMLATYEKLFGRKGWQIKEVR